MNRLIAILCVTLSIHAAEPKKTQETYELGRAAMAHGDHVRAVEYFEQSTALSPRNALYQLQLGRAYSMSAMASGMFSAMSLAKKAKSAFERAVELDPKFVPARLSLLEFLIGAPAILGGSDSAALEQAKAIREIDPIEGHDAFARIHIAAKRADLARGEYATMVKTFPRSAQAHYLYGVYLLTTEKNYKSAADQFESAVSIDPNHMASYFRIGHTAAVGSANFARGEEALKKYISYRPSEEEPGTSRAWFWLGAIYEKEGRPADAKSCYATSLKLNPTQKDVIEALKRVS
ncbi:MAG: tetratricopeptide repeat protein [Acidobacteria bacterium]|nr:tetratricopeptide repeat protein [Acidobacteriota bacterium]MBV9071751.1 tetratricopeptide repeat protein [Acidobacteriota bacterium]MBV9187063.1 tetratricopeptide repeat protein [Acidobacteriota bacterium]